MFKFKYVCLLLSTLITSCGGTNNITAIPENISAGAECEVKYTLTENPLLSGIDPYYMDQWYLKNTGQSGGVPGEDINIYGAWKYTKGQGVVISIIDNAVELVHPDLAPNVIPGSLSYRQNNESNLPIPCLKKESHGTAVAGIIAARDNNSLGITGVAPRSSIVVSDSLITSIDQQIYESLTRNNQIVSIYHNSWGSPDNGSVNSSGNLFEQAITKGINSGRQGLGSIFVFSSGNGGAYDNSNLDGFLNKRGIISVCSINDNGSKTSRSEPGANILICAYGEGTNKNIVTLALNGQYRSDFSGSSAAAPQVTGVVALLLSVRPDLSWRDIQQILAKSARKNHSSDSQWRPAKGGSGWVHPFYGYGVVDATSAVELALKWSSVGLSDRQIKCDSGLQLANYDILDYIYQQPLTVTVNMNCKQIKFIEFVEIEVSTIHSSSGDLRIDLTSPWGSNSRLVDSRTCYVNSKDPCGSFRNWRFGSVHQMDEPADGIWRLTIADQRLYNAGILESWRIIIYGR